MLLVPPTASPRSIVGSSPGRLRADHGRQQSSYPGTQTPGVQGPCSEGQPWATQLHTRLRTLVAVPGRKQPSCPVCLPVQQRSPALEHIISLNIRKARSAIQKDPTSCGIYQHWKITLVQSSDLPCSQTLTFSRAVKISPPVRSQHPPTPDCP